MVVFTSSAAPISLGAACGERECEAAHPVRIGLFSADAVAHHPDLGTHLIQESGRGAGSCLAIFHPENFRLS